MTTVELKSNFHKLIDDIDNETILSKFYEISYRSKNSKEKSEWSKLSQDEQNELILIEKESHIPNNLISHSDRKKNIRNGFRNFLV